MEKYGVGTIHQYNKDYCDLLTIVSKCEEDKHKRVVLFNGYEDFGVCDYVTRN